MALSFVKLSMYFKKLYVTIYIVIKTFDALII